MELENIYRNKTVLVTGHTGFKGSWLCEWLLQLGAKIVGYSLEPPTTPSHYALSGLSGRLHEDLRADVRDIDTLKKAVMHHRPDFVFHLAAQPIVLTSFEEPLSTVQTNPAPPTRSQNGCTKSR